MLNEEAILDNIKTLMQKNKRWTYRSLAEFCNLNQSQLHRILHHQAKLPLSVALKIAEAFEVDLEKDILKGIPTRYSKKNDSASLRIGILSIGGQRITCAVSPENEIIGYSLLEGSLDLVEHPEELIKKISESAYDALGTFGSTHGQIFSKSTLNLVTQSYEFEKTRKKFILFAHKYFDNVTLLPDWVVTLLAAFRNKEGIALVTDKGVSLSYLFENRLHKIGGWKYPVYDLGGENWLGAETIHHTIDAAEGHIPMTYLASQVLSKFNGKIEKITEYCLQSGDPDVYCSFTEQLKNAYFTGDKEAQRIIHTGFHHVQKLVTLADQKIGKPLSITLNGSLDKIYGPLLERGRIISSINDIEKAELLAHITAEELSLLGVTID